MRSKRLAAFLVLAIAGVLTFQAEVQGRHRQRCCAPCYVCSCEPQEEAVLKKVEFLVTTVNLKGIMFDPSGALRTTGRVFILVTSVDSGQTVGGTGSTSPTTI